jgi:hypothetical protein
MTFYWVNESHSNIAIEYLQSWQVNPWNPGRHWHVKLSMSCDWHRPPFMQGFGMQTSPEQAGYQMKTQIDIKMSRDFSQYMHMKSNRETNNWDYSDVHVCCLTTLTVRCVTHAARHTLTIDNTPLMCSTWIRNAGICWQMAQEVNRRTIEMSIEQCLVCVRTSFA